MSKKQICDNPPVFLDVYDKGAILTIESGGYTHDRIPLDFKALAQMGKTIREALQREENTSSKSNPESSIGHNNSLPNDLLDNVLRNSSGFRC